MRLSHSIISLSAFLLALAPLALHAAEESIVWRSQLIKYEGAELKKINWSPASAQELVLIYTNTSPDAVNSLTLPADVKIEGRILAVGGGGGGGTIKGSTYSSYAGGGGGGAGELVDRSVIFNGEKFLISIGAGGTGGEGDGSAAVAAKAQGGAGGASAITNVIDEISAEYLLVKGGGGGGGQAAGEPGGSGGGSSAGSSAIADGGAAQPNEADGHGNAGGGSIKRYAGGGGGAGAPGDPGVDGVAGAGGNGWASDITGDELWYAGGGGGGTTYSGKTVGAKGKGGGGLGAGVTKTTIPTAGDPATGGGGGGGSRYWPGQPGGSGIVIIRLIKMEKPISWVEIPLASHGWLGKLEVDAEAYKHYTWQGDELLITYSYTGDKGGIRVTDGFLQARALLIGGGGAGGSGYSATFGNAAPGGGGAGGFAETNNVILSGTYTIMVGAGGASGTKTPSVPDSGKDGGQTTIQPDGAVDPYFCQGLIAYGGGGGGAGGGGSDIDPINNGRSGGSGGGGSSRREGNARIDGEGGVAIDNGAQGNDGARGSNENVGGGGGGAGSAAAAITADSAPGGDGRMSDITGSEVWYAGGGGGGNKANNSGNYSGGKGGGGKGGTYYSDTVYSEPTDGADGFGGGGGAGNKLKNGGRGGNGIVIIRIKLMVPYKVPVPVGLITIYDGTEKTGVVESVAYTLSGQVRETNADNYHIVATLNPSLPAVCEWADGLEPKRGDRDVWWRIRQRELPVPRPVTGFVYDDTEKVAYAGEMNGDNCVTSYVEGVKLEYCTLSGYRETHAGSYTFTATLVADYESTPNVTNFVWTSDSMEPQPVSWSIASATNLITSLTIDDWQEDTAGTSGQPTAEAKYRNATDQFEFRYARSETEPSHPGDYNITEKPTEAGVYWVRAYLCKDSEHDPGDWLEAARTARFCIWRHPSKTLTDYVDVTVSGYTGSSTLKDFPVLVRLREAVDGERGGGIPGFTYSRAGDGSAIRFVAISNLSESAIAPEDRDNPLARDSLLPYEIDVWNPNGESLVWVKVPSLAKTGTKFRLYWHRNPDEVVYPDLLPEETWNDDYIGVWHLNRIVDGTLPNSTKLGGVLDAVGEVDFVDSPLGVAAVTKAGNVQAPDYEPHMGAANSPFTFSAWYRGDNYAAAGYSMMCGKKGTNAYNWNGGWCWEMNKSKTSATAYANNSAFTAKTVTDITKNWHHFSYNAAKEGSSASHAVYADGAAVQSTSKTTSTNALPLTVIGDLFAGNEARLSKVQRTADWTKAEYESMSKANFCSFALVSTVDEEGRAWVNWWSRPPNIKRYWDLGTLKPELVDAVHGELFDRSGTSITNIFTKMPDLTPVDFPKADEKGAYTVEFTMFNPEAGTTAYPGRHILFGGSYVFDIEIVEHNPQPIDPHGPLGTTCSGRVLLVNDDTNPDEPVEGQRYDRIAQEGMEVNPYWEHDAAPSPMEEINLKPGTTHTLHYIDRSGAKTVTNAVWTLTGAYIGNMLFTNETASLSNNWNTLPSAPTASENAQIVLQNFEGARIESQLYTNGIGTVYFDAVNVYAGTDVSAADYKLVVEVATNENTWGAVWGDPVPMTVLYWDGSKVTTNATGKTALDCLNVKNGGNLTTYRFYCAYAKVNEHAPARFRIRRVSERKGLVVNDPDGFILIDNVTASWPAKEPRIVPTGRYDETLENKRVLGMEGAFTGGYPAARDSFSATVKLSGGTAEDVSSARLHYRWRYLGKRFDPAPQDGKDVWSVEYLDLSTLSTLGPISGNGTVGDIEYWFDLTAFVPYYEYVDHSGVGFDKAVASEEPPKNAVSCSQYGPYPSQGTNWFVRLREGASPYRGIRALLRRHDTPGAAPQAVDLELVSDNLWRGYFRVREKVAAGWDCRFEAEEPLDFEAGTLKTNHWLAAESPEKMPVSCGLDLNGATNRWSVLPGEKQTGYYMLQIDDKAESLAVVHADYQNFNTWHDARKGPGAFVGTTNDVSGASSQVRDYDEEFANWRDTVAENSLWNETFTDPTATHDGDYFKRGYNGVPLLTKFASATTLNNWSAGSSEYIPGLYQEARVLPGLSLQMDGRGGFLQFVDAGASPRGLESVAFRARVAQQVGFGDFCYNLYNMKMNDYSFIAYAAFDRNSNRDFSGNASLSVVAFYRPNVGCYEARWEQIKANSDFSGPDPKGQRLSLYRWSVNKGNVVTCTPLGSITNDVFEIPQTTSSAAATYLPIYISVKDCRNEDSTTHVMVGVRRAGLMPSEGYASLKGVKFFSLCYKDKSAQRLTAGTYGLLSANCRGVFLKPGTTKSVAFPVTVSANDKPVAAKDSTIEFSTNPEDYADEKANLKPADPDYPDLIDWTMPGSRMQVFGLETDNNWGIEALDQTAKLAFYTAPKGTANWSKDPVQTFPVSGFGAAGRAGTDYEPEIFSLDDCSVKIAAAGGDGDAACDIVIDDISMRQWRGENYGDPGTWTAPDDGYGWRTNFVFSSGWITDHAVKLSAKRTKAGSNSALRSPLMDGVDGRGLGLGMISFEYRNAQENAKLLVDIATNLTGRTAKIDESQWVNYTNIDFSAMLPVARQRGVQTVYLGLRGVSGMMRVRVDPEVIAAVSNVTDRTKFGEVTVTRVFCRDEPELDDESWWGWNLRTTDEPEEAYLPDQTLSANAGLSYALNNSTTDGLSEKDRTTIDQHMPFLQTPTFGSDIVGEVSFRARKYDLDPLSQKAEIRVYGASSGQLEDDTKWTEIGHVVVSNDQYTSYRLQVNGSYHAFRLGVTGVPGVKDGSRGPAPTEGKQPVRVLIEEVVVSQAITPLLGFEYVRPFREGLDDDVTVPDILSCDQQPLLGESWSVQAEIKARQLASEIDFDTPGHEPRVIFHWFAGMRPWGYDNWRDRGNTAELVRPAGEKMVFRGGFTLAPDAVVEPSAAQTYAVVQYMAEVVYWSVNGKCKTNTLSEGEWKRPEWYDPLDLNRDNESWHSFSAYNILEGIAPRRVWINEANLYDGMVGGHYPASTNQYIEVAAPMQQTIEGWRLAYVDNNYKTNDLCTFGMNGVSSVKTMNATNEYVFFSVQSPKTRDAKTLNISKGEVDGTWKDFNMNGGELGETLPIGLRLIRPSGIVEQEIVLEGTNSWASSVWGDEYSASNMVRHLNAYAAGAGGGERWYEVGNEYRGGRSDSLGVTNFIGAVKEDWSSPMGKTPGRANVGQIVPENYVIYPNGSLLVVYSSVDANGHVKQTFGTVTNSTEASIGITAKGGEGTNITYRVDDWWEIKSLTTNGVAVPGWAGRTGKQVFTAGKGESNSVYVIATAQPRADIRELIGPDNAYEDAILDWLGKGKTMKGKFENPGEIQLGEYWPKIEAPPYRGRRKLDLTETYWLDIDPTSSNWVLHAGFCDPMPHEVPMEDASRPNAIRMGIYMAITNVNPESEKFGLNWSPYMLRGLKPGETSQDYSPTNPNAWTSVTFKITGDIQNGMPLRKRWMPLRWFTFDAGSFKPDHTTVIDILNPYDTASPAASYGWRDYIGTQVFYSWNIDTRLRPITVEVLRPESKLGKDD